MQTIGRWIRIGVVERSIQTPNAERLYLYDFESPGDARHEIGQFAECHERAVAPHEYSTAG